MTPLEPEAREMFSVSVRRLLGDAPVGLNAPSALRKDVWADMAAVGTLGLALPHWAGGADASLSDIGIVMRALGRSLAGEPFVSCAVIAAPLLARCDSEEARKHAMALGRGSTVIALAHFEPQLGFARHPVGAQAILKDGAWCLSGRKTLVFDASVADRFLVSAVDAGGGLGLYLVEADEEGLHTDLTVSVTGAQLGELQLSSAKALRVADHDVANLMDWGLDRAVVACCAQALGAMECVIEQTKAYLQMRRAFGKYLSQFQVLQHRLVDMTVALEEAEAIVELAELACDSDPQNRAQIVAACKVTTSRSARFVASQGIQLHGGVGMTEELSIGSYYKSLMMLEARFGNGEHHLEAYSKRARASLGRDPSPSILEPSQ